MTGTAAELLALVLLGAALAVAVVRPASVNEVIVAGPAAALVVVLGVVPASAAGTTLRELFPTVAFLAAILVFGHLCAEAGCSTTSAPGQRPRAVGQRPACSLSSSHLPRWSPRSSPSTPLWCC
ncbi:MAG: hypothetical protein ABJA87_13475 [bacterium]